MSAVAVLSLTMLLYRRTLVHQCCVLQCTAVLPCCVSVFLFDFCTHKQCLSQDVEMVERARSAPRNAGDFCSIAVSLNAVAIDLCSSQVF